MALYPVLKTSASGHVECRSSRLRGGNGWHWTSACVKGGLQCLIRLQSPNHNKTSGHTGHTICFWRIIDFHRKWIDAQRRRKQEKHMCRRALSPHDRSKASHNIICVLFWNSNIYMVCWVARLVILVSMVNTENTSDIYYDGVLWINYNRILSISTNKIGPDVIQF